MDTICHDIIMHFAQNLKAYGIGGGLFLFTAVANMPKPGIKWTKLVLYTWLYETLQTLMPLVRNHPFSTTQYSQLDLETSINQSQLEEPKAKIPMPPRYGVK